MFKALLSLSLLSNTATAADYPQLPAMGSPGRAAEYEQTLDLAIVEIHLKEATKCRHLIREKDTLANILAQYDVANSKIKDYINVLTQIQPLLTQMIDLSIQNNNANAVAVAPPVALEQIYQDKLITITSLLRPLSHDMREYNIYSETSSQYAAQPPSVVIDSIPLYCLDYIWTTLQGTTIAPGTVNNSQMILNNLIHQLIPLEQKKLDGIHQKIEIITAPKKDRVLTLMAEINKSISLQLKYLKNLQENGFDD